ncbi:MAG: ABC transporter permease [Hyphomicrobium sp.]|uniref:ABC transporter permease n=1 Tax=Hyphomicrobium sp. TaxID=82 RepID=UPI003D14D127
MTGSRPRIKSEDMLFRKQHAAVPPRAERPRQAHVWTSVHQLLWIETLLKLTAGAALVLAPLTAIKVLGLPPSANAFWPRLLGGVLIGLAAATFLEGATERGRGLGMAGLILINTAGGTVLAFSAAFGGSAPTRRGRLAQWSIVVLLFVLSLFEIAYL